MCFIVMTSVFFSCNLSKNIPYFKDIPDTTNQVINKPQAEYSELKIRPNDILFITIQTVEPQTNSLINSTLSTSNISAMSSENLGQNSATPVGYLVDFNGFIELPIVGRMKVEGLSTAQASEIVRKSAEQFFNNPTINVRFGNFAVSVLGEVTRPGIYRIANEKATILDAISLAGDLTIFGKRDNILVIRDFNGRKEFARLSINNTNFLNSKYYYLQQGDIIYVEPNKSKVVSSDLSVSRNISLALTGVSLTISLINMYLFRIKN